MPESSEYVRTVPRYRDKLDTLARRFTASLHIPVDNYYGLCYCLFMEVTHMTNQNVPRGTEDADSCPICTRGRAHPWRAYDTHGHVIAGCISAFHTGYVVSISESFRWHNRPEARAIRARIAKGQKGLGY